MKRAFLVCLLVGLASSAAMAYDPAPWRDGPPGGHFVPVYSGDSIRAARAEVERARWRLRQDLRDRAPRYVIERDERRLRRAEERLQWEHDRRGRPYRPRGDW